MRVLITSGGTKVKIDDVRHIGNMSNGTLGAKLARSALICDNEVIFFRAEKSKSPMSVNLDFKKGSLASLESDFQDVKRLHDRFGHLYTEIEYKTFEDYQEKLPDIIKLYKPDVIVLAAAVSDYGTMPVVGKIRSKTNLNIELYPLPKIIANVRQWAGKKAFVVGFKLLVDVVKEELFASAIDSFNKNNLDMVCANDLKTIQAGDHVIYVFKDNPKNGPIETTPQYLWGLIHANAQRKVK